jgi:ceramide glucosyltransferase
MTILVAGLTLFYLGMVVYSIVRLCTRKEVVTRLPSELQGISVIASLHGNTPQLKLGLECILDQKYDGPIEFIIGIESSKDPVFAQAQEIVSNTKSKVIVKFFTDIELRGANPRNSKMLHGYNFSKHPWLYWHAIDSIIVDNYFETAVSMTQNDPLKYVTAFPVNIRPKSFGALVETVALNLEVTKFFIFSTASKKGAVAYGGSFFFSRELLEKSGGLDSTLNRFTEDVILASAFKKNGAQCLLSPYLTYVPQEKLTFRGFWNRQVRWLLIARFYMPQAFFSGPFFSFPQIFLVAGLIFHREFLIQTALGLFVLRVVQAFFFEILLRAPKSDWWCALFLPVYDILFPFLWIKALLTQKVNWSGNIMIADSKGVLRKG